MTPEQKIGLCIFGIVIGLTLFHVGGILLLEWWDLKHPPPKWITDTQAKNPLPPGAYYGQD